MQNVILHFFELIYSPGYDTIDKFPQVKWHWTWSLLCCTFVHFKIKLTSIDIAGVEVPDTVIGSVEGGQPSHPHLLSPVWNEILCYRSLKVQVSCSCCSFTWRVFTAEKARKNCATFKPKEPPCLPAWALLISHTRKWKSVCQRKTGPLCYMVCSVV